MTTANLVIQNKFSKFYIGEIVEKYNNSRVHQDKANAKQFTSKKDAEVYIAKLIKGNMGITSRSNVVLVPV